MGRGAEPPRGGEHVREQPRQQAGGAGGGGSGVTCPRGCWWPWAPTGAAWGPGLPAPSTSTTCDPKHDISYGLRSAVQCTVIRLNWDIL